MLRRGADGFTPPPPPGEVVLWIFNALGSPSSSAGFQPTDLESNGKHATTRPLMATCQTWFRCQLFAISSLDSPEEYEVLWLLFILTTSDYFHVLQLIIPDTIA
jgi:hypothetical protein